MDKNTIAISKSIDLSTLVESREEKKNQGMEKLRT